MYELLMRGLVLQQQLLRHAEYVFEVRQTGVVRDELHACAGNAGDGGADVGQRTGG